MFIRTSPFLPLQASFTICQRLVDAIGRTLPNEIWAIHQIEVITKPPYTLLDVEAHASKLLDFCSLEDISNTFDDIINLKFSTFKDGIGLDVDLEDIAAAGSGTYVEFFDSTYWTVYSRNREFLTDCVKILIQ